MSWVAGLVPTAIVVGLASCAHTGGMAHAGRDATAHGARSLGVLASDDLAAQPDVVTARGGDPVDWYVFSNERKCRSFVVALATEPARPGLDVALRVVEPDGSARARRLRQEATRADRDAQAWFRHTKDARVRAIRVENASLGHYYVGVHTIGDSAARYRLVVRDATNGFECGDAMPWEPSVVLRAAPSVALPDVAPDSIAAPTTRALAIRRQPPPPAPLTARVVDRWTKDGAVYVAFDRGSIDGIAVGWQASERGGSAGRVAEVHGNAGVARLDGTTLDAVLRLGALQLAPSK